MNALQRLSDLGLVLPAAASGLGSYLPWSRTGSVVTTSGQFPWSGVDLAYQGRLGEVISIADGYQAARLCALNAIAQLRDAAGGDLENVARVLRLEGNLLCTPDFVDHAGVLNGASDLINDVFGERGRHSRAVTGVASMPLGSPVLLYVQAEVK
ncbi:RidA family protein [Kutzneria sp. NPDC052558]|uniref:RidA family protein n=1 Tax=Kutzneria sp. NPDC052558 TaxID=3364121 RepID=UPI0037C97CB9